MSTALDEKIAHVAAIKMCRFCKKPVPPEAVICACRIERGELPHTEWGRDVKRFLAVRAVERQQLSHMTEQDLWVKLAVANYFGRWLGEGRDRKLISTAVSIVDVFPFAAGESALWAASGYPTLFHI